MTAVDVAQAQAWIAAVATRASGLVTFEAGPHIYRRRDTGRIVPGVTSVLKATGHIDDTWFTEESQQRGTWVHEATVSSDKDEALREPTESAQWLGNCDEWWSYLESYERFVEVARPIVLASELMLYDPELDVAGTCDRLWILKDRLWLPDFKAGAKEKWHPLQTAAYRRMLLKLSEGLKWVPTMIRRGTLLLKENGAPAQLTPHDVPEHRGAEQEWVGAVKEYREREETVDVR